MNRITGPQLNNNSPTEQSRDCLGLENVATSMAAKICTIVNTVTPRAFYWAFLVWIYYDFQKTNKPKDWTKANITHYLKRQDYFFVLATLLADGDQEGLAGKRQAKKDIETESNIYTNNPNYYQHRYGGMQYHYAGCLTMKLIKDKREDGKKYEIPKITKKGEKLAIAFDNAIKGTTYYKKYKDKEKVPREVLEEYGKVISLNMENFPECKTLLRGYLFENQPSLKLCADYITFLHEKCNIESINEDNYRKIFFDHKKPDNTPINIPDNLKEIAEEWELVIGRLYFVIGIEMIWAKMLWTIETFQKDWITKTLEESEFTWNLKDTIKSVLPSCYYDYETREELIEQAKDREDNSIENGLKILFSMYNWLSKKKDSNWTYFGLKKNAISLEEFRHTIENYMDKSIEEFLIFVMKKWIIEQHQITAFEKMLDGRNDFFFEQINGYYIATKPFWLGFNRNRIVNLESVMIDLDML